MHELLQEAGAVPSYDNCGGILKPGVVFFEEQLPAPAIDAAIELAETSALRLVVGSALEVHPVAGLPDRAASRGGWVAVINLGPTSIDRQAALKLDTEAGATLARVVDLIKETAGTGG